MSKESKIHQSIEELRKYFKDNFNLDLERLEDKFSAYTTDNNKSYGFIVGEKDLFSFLVELNNNLTINTNVFYLESEKYINLSKIQEKLAKKYPISSIKCLELGPQFMPEVVFKVLNKKGIYALSLLVNLTKLNIKNEEELVKKTKEIVKDLFKELKKEANIYFCDSEEYTEEIGKILPRV